MDSLLVADPNSPDLRRLHPPAYLDDPDRDTEYRLLAGEELRASRHAAIDAVLLSLDQERLSEDELWSWLQAINALRLVVGTRLDITDEDHDPNVPPDHPDANLWTIYGFATWLQYQVLLALGA